jgi:hypothetical protein
VIPVPAVTEVALDLNPCILPCTRYAAAWTHGVEQRGGRARPYQSRASGRRVGTVYHVPRAPAAVDMAGVGAVARGLALDGPQVLTAAQRCQQAVEAARPSLLAIDLGFGELTYFVEEESLHVVAPPRYGPKLLDLQARPRASAAEQNGDRHTDTDDRLDRVSDTRAVSIHVELGDTPRRRRILDTLRPVVEVCLQ